MAITYTFVHLLPGHEVAGRQQFGFSTFENGVLTLEETYDIPFSAVKYAIRAAEPAERPKRSKK